MKRVGAAVGIVVVLAGAASAGGASNRAQQRKADCTWGASSVTARYVDGRWVVDTPHTSGCATP
jgi:hypothetical protein